MQFPAWGCESGVSATPEPGNRFRLRLRLRCVRACVRSCVRDMIPMWLGSGGRIYGSVPLRPCGPAAGPDQKLELFEFRPMIRDRVELLSVPVWWSRCVVCVSCVFRGGVRCWIAVLDPPVSLCQRVLDPPVSMCQRGLVPCESL